jgi:hypothetical protein
MNRLLYMDASTFNRSLMTVDQYFVRHDIGNISGFFGENNDNFYGNTSRPLKDEATIDLADDNIKYLDDDMVKAYHKPDGDEYNDYIKKDSQSTNKLSLESNNKLSNSDINRSPVKSGLNLNKKLSMFDNIEENIEYPKSNLNLAGRINFNSHNRSQHNNEIGIDHFPLQSEKGSTNKSLHRENNEDRGFVNEGEANSKFSSHSNNKILSNNEPADDDNESNMVQLKKAGTFQSNAQDNFNKSKPVSISESTNKLPSQNSGFQNHEDLLISRNNSGTNHKLNSNNNNDNQPSYKPHSSAIGFAGKLISNNSIKQDNNQLKDEGNDKLVISRRRSSMRGMLGGGGGGMVKDDNEKEADKHAANANNQEGNKFEKKNIIKPKKTDEFDLLQLLEGSLNNLSNNKFGQGVIKHSEKQYIESEGIKIAKLQFENKPSENLIHVGNDKIEQENAVGVENSANGENKLELNGIISKKTSQIDESVKDKTSKSIQNVDETQNDKTIQKVEVENSHNAEETQKDNTSKSIQKIEQRDSQNGDEPQKDKTSKSIQNIEHRDSQNVDEPQKDKTSKSIQKIDAKEINDDKTEKDKTSKSIQKVEAENNNNQPEVTKEESPQINEETNNNDNKNDQIVKTESKANLSQYNSSSSKLKILNGNKEEEIAFEEIVKKVSESQINQNVSNKSLPKSEVSKQIEKQQSRVVKTETNQNIIFVQNSSEQLEAKNSIDINLKKELVIKLIENGSTKNLLNGDDLKKATDKSLGKVDSPKLEEEAQVKGDVNTDPVKLKSNKLSAFNSMKSDVIENDKRLESKRSQKIEQDKISKAGGVMDNNELGEHGEAEPEIIMSKKSKNIESENKMSQVKPESSRKLDSGNKMSQIKPESSHKLKSENGNDENNNNNDIENNMKEEGVDIKPPSEHFNQVTQTNDRLISGINPYNEIIENEEEIAVVDDINKKIISNRNLGANGSILEEKQASENISFTKEEEQPVQESRLLGHMNKLLNKIPYGRIIEAKEANKINMFVEEAVSKHSSIKQNGEETVSKHSSIKQHEGDEDRASHGQQSLSKQESIKADNVSKRSKRSKHSSMRQQSEVKSSNMLATQENIENNEAENRYIQDSPQKMLSENKSRFSGANMSKTRLHLADENNTLDGNTIPTGTEIPLNENTQQQADEIVINNNFVNSTNNNIINPLDSAHEKAAIEEAIKNSLISVHDYDKLKAEEALKHDKRSFGRFFSDMISQHHTLLSIFMKLSIIDPVYIRIFKFFAICHMIYGFNAIMYTDDYIELLATNQTVKFILN